MLEVQPLKLRKIEMAEVSSEKKQEEACLRCHYVQSYQHILRKAQGASGTMQEHHLKAHTVNEDKKQQKDSTEPHRWKKSSPGAHRGMRDRLEQG